MKVQIYLLGFLKKYGPLHGYKLKQLISTSSAEFVDIKLPIVYYHLERLEKHGHVSVAKDKKGNRPERLIYTITDSGIELFEAQLTEALGTRYKQEFTIDAALLFSAFISEGKLKSVMLNRMGELEIRLKTVITEKEVAVKGLEGINKLIKESLFEHQRMHIEAELKWMKDLTNKLDVYNQ